MLDFEKHKQAGENYLSCDVEKNLCFPMHCNETYEFLYCNDGLANVTVLDRIYRLRAGKCMVIPPKFAHAYETPDYSRSFRLISSVKLCETYFAIAFRTSTFFLSTGINAVCVSNSARI